MPVRLSAPKWVRARRCRTTTRVYSISSQCIQAQKVAKMRPGNVGGNARDAIVVVGAGIVGVCTAWHLLRRGADVTLIDRDDPGLGCSHGNAGALSCGSLAPLAMPGVM